MRRSNRELAASRGGRPTPGGPPRSTGNAFGRLRAEVNFGVELRIAWAVTALVVTAAVASARADGPFEGDWRQGPATVDVQVRTWGPDCGTRPQSTTVPGRGVIRVTQDGDHLTFGGRRSTRGCWSDNHAVRLVSSRVQAGTWTILCRTAPDDPRRETGTYTLRASGTQRIEFRDETEYDWTLNNSHCTARVVTSQVFERIGSTAGTPSAAPRPVEPPSTRAPASPEPPCTAGPASRLTLRPSNVQAAPGERVCFLARVLDNQGCPIRAADVVWSVGSTAVGTMRGSCLDVVGPGQTDVVARSGSLEARATVLVSATDLSGLIARRAETDLSAGNDEASASQEAGVAARTAAVERWPGWLVPVAAAALVAALVLSFVLGIRSRRRRQRDVNLGAETTSERVSVSVQPSPPTATPSGPTICPVCRRGFAAGVATCPKDGVPLVPYAEFAAGRDRALPERVCPKCGTSYPGTTKFCGKDGAALG